MQKITKIIFRVDEFKKSAPKNLGKMKNQFSARRPDFSDYFIIFILWYKKFNL